MRLLRCLFNLFVCGILFFAADVLAAGDQTPESPSAFILGSRYTFNPVLEGTEILHDFVVQNKGSAELKIEQVRTD